MYAKTIVCAPNSRGLKVYTYERVLCVRYTSCLSVNNKLQRNVSKTTLLSSHEHRHIAYAQSLLVYMHTRLPTPD